MPLRCIFYLTNNLLAKNQKFFVEPFWDRILQIFLSSAIFSEWNGCEAPIEISFVPFVFGDVCNFNLRNGLHLALYKAWMF